MNKIRAIAASFVRRVKRNPVVRHSVEVAVGLVVVDFLEVIELQASELAGIAVAIVGLTGWGTRRMVTPWSPSASG